MTPVSRVAVVAISVVAWSVGISCTSGPPNDYCEVDGDCLALDGFEVCELAVNRCVAVDCLEDSHCEIGTYCGENNFCIPGCATDIDCFADQHCDSENRACITDGCTDSQIDCAYGEFCQDSGECEFVPAEPGCQTCTPDPWGFDLQGSCPSGGKCLSFNPVEGFEQYENESYCFFDCHGGGDNACPRGYECQTQDFDGTGEQSVCVAYCPVLYELGVL